MVNISLDGSPCWISSIVRLPLFYNPGDILYAEMNAQSTDIYSPYTMTLRQNRNLKIPPHFAKYKLEVRFRDGVVDVIGASLDPFDPRLISSGDIRNETFYPLFAHMGSECFLFVDSIDAMFREGSMIVSNEFVKSVISPMELIRRVDNHMAHSQLSQHWDTSISKVVRPHSSIELLMEIMNGASGSDSRLEATYGVSQFVVPEAIKMLGEVRRASQLMRFMHPMGCVPSDIASIAMCQDFAQMKNFIDVNGILPRKVNDIYLYEVEDRSPTGEWLSAIYSQPFNDFSFDIRQDILDLSDLYVQHCNVYDDFRHAFWRVKDWNHLMSCLIMAFNLGKYNIKNNETKLHVQRSWLEDLVIKDDNDNVVLYVDLVMWMLACSNGLINASILETTEYF